MPVPSNGDDVTAAAAGNTLVRARFGDLVIFPPVKRPVLYFLYLLYIVETGVFLVLVPWSLLWVHSYFAQIPPLRPVMMSGFLRGSVSAIGLIQIGMGSVDFLSFCRALKRA